MMRSRKYGSGWVGGACWRDCSCYEGDGVRGEAVGATGVLTLAGGVAAVLKNINKIWLLCIQRERGGERERERERVAVDTYK